MDFDASGNYEEIGVSQLLSVPYAMYAKSSGNSYWEKSDEGIYNNMDNVSIGSNSPSNLLSISLPEAGDQKDRGFSLNRNTGHLDLINGTLYDGHFQARISAKSTHENSPGMVIAATPFLDQVNKHGILLRAGENEALQNANAFTIQNFDQSLITVKADGKTGFGVENPDYQVDVSGAVNASNFYLNGESFRSSLWSENQNDIFFSTGNIGIGDSAPNNLINISLPETGDQQDKGFSLSRNDGYLNLINGTLYDGHFQARISAKSTHENSPGMVIAATPFLDQVNKHGILLRAGENEALQNANAFTIQNFDQSLITVKADGKTGFGVENPDYQVDVSGAVNASNFYLNGEAVKSGVWNENQNDIFFNTGNIGVGTNAPNNLFNVTLPETGNQKDKGISLSRNDGFLNLLNGTLYDGHFQARISGQSTHEDSPGIVITATPAIDEVNKHGILLRAGENQALQNANALTIQNFDQSLITVKSDGKIGFGIENPNYQVDVSGGVNASNFYLNGEAVKSGVWNENQNDIFFNTGNIGVGTNAPNNLFNVTLPETGNQKDKGISLSRNDGFLNLLNGTLYDGHFQARISGQSTHEDSPGIVITATPAIDEVNKHGILLRAGENEALQNANALTIQNFDQNLITVKSDGKTGIGTTDPKSKLQVTDGDIYIEDASSGVIMTSPDGNCWRMTVNNSGNPEFTSTTCPE